MYQSLLTLLSGVKETEARLNAITHINRVNIMKDIITGLKTIYLESNL